MSMSMSMTAIVTGTDFGCVWLLLFLLAVLGNILFDLWRK